ncbi:DC-STAMP domain-containing protein 2 isoform X2 [Anastrepha obliqua]|uniref:DC-STAMP domain-containing protein 2 isoform X2 n=1 Tax=Anastrepha obliqua TaxID=95512 RepID=UPI002409FF72|nr:DC-STAMP domain-containing protein 2 isoform X2 [Anastrepha obliqua]
MSDDTSTTAWPATTATNDHVSITTKSTKSTATLGPQSRKNEHRNFSGKTIVTLLICGYLTGMGLFVAWHMYETDNVQLLRGKWLKYNAAVLVFLLFAYSRHVRCIATLCIPILCSSKGRSLLIAFAFVMVAMGPTVNIFRNVDVLVRSLSCGQMQLKEALEEMLEVMRQPLVAIKKSVRTAMNNIKQVVKKVELLLFRIKELVLVILSAIKNMFEWLKSIVSFCNKELGTPFDRCMRTADDAMKDCRAIYFKMKYLRQPGYNNHYLTKDILQIDEQRKGAGLERLLPLKKSEKRKYIWISNCRLTRREIYRLMRSMLFLFISVIQIFCICFFDYSLYWTLAMINYYGSQEANVEVPPFITVDVKGGGYTAEIFRGIVQAFEPLSQKYNIDATPCLPVPKRPNLKRYMEIAGICLLAWICFFCEPYGLRLRHVVMRLYYPAEARQRAAWLYNEILMKRMTFFKLMRRKARAKFKNEPKSDPYTFLDWLRAKTASCFLCRFILGHRKSDTCILCGFPLKEDKVECSNPGCQAVYCQSCFDESNKNCCICKRPVEYGDDSDISEEKDSSDDPSAVREPRESDKYCIWVP